MTTTTTARLRLRDRVDLVPVTASWPRPRVIEQPIRMADGQTIPGNAAVKWAGTIECDEDLARYDNKAADLILEDGEWPIILDRLGKAFHGSHGAPGVT